MRYCIFTIIRKEFDLINFEEFIRSLSDTVGDYFFLVISAVKKDIEGILKSNGIRDFYVLHNCVDPGLVTLINQGLSYGVEKFKYSIYINSSKSLVTSKNWLEEINFRISEKKDFSLGGSVKPLKITFGNEFNKILYSINRRDPSWISRCTNKLMITNFVDGNIFITDNSKLKQVGLLDNRYHSEKNFSIALSLKFLEKGLSLTDIDSIYSSTKDSMRHDIGNVIKAGAKIVCPVIIRSVRQRILEARV